MKKLINTTGMLLLCLLFTSSLKAQVHYATITGKVSPELHYVVLFDKTKNYGISESSDTIRIAKDKTFKYRLNIKEAGLVQLGYGDNKYITLWLKPGDVLSIDLRNKDPEFKGTPAVFERYIISDQDYWKKLYADYKKRNPDYDKGDNRWTDKYFTIQDSMVIDRLNFLKNYFSGVITSDKQAFVKQQNLSLYYSNLYAKLLFDGADPEKFKFYQDRFKILRPYHYAMSNKAEFNNISLLSNSGYRSFFYGLVDAMARKRLKDKGEKYNYSKYLDLCMPVIDDLTEGASTTNDLKAIFLNSVELPIRASKNLVYANKVNTFINDIPGGATNTGLQLVKQKIHKIILETKFNPGAKAPDFIVKDINGKAYSLNDFKGKKIYIDMCASWCPHCIETFPAWNKLVAANSNNENVIFISLSLDDKESDWKALIKKHTISGMKLYAGEGGVNSSFGTGYDIFGLPHFMLIDEEGKIIRYEAPGPDSDEIAAILQKK